MRKRVLHTTALVCELVGVVLLFFWAWPQPSFETEDILAVGPSANARQIISQKHQYSARAAIGLACLLAGCGIQIYLVWAKME